jgi:hypothetical protein
MTWYPPPLEPLSDREHSPIPTNDIMEQLDKETISSDDIETDISENDYNYDTNDSEDDPVLNGKSIIIPETIPYHQLINHELNNVDIDKYFNIESIIQNQNSFIPYRIIRNYLDGIDTENEIDSLPPQMKKDVIKHHKYEIKQDTLLYIDKSGRHRICLPPDHQRAIMEYVHTDLLSGMHSNKESMKKEIMEHYYWPYYSEDIDNYCKRCQSCQFGKKAPNRKVGYMELFPAQDINDIVAIDHKGPILPATKEGYQYITTYYDRFSGYTVSIPAKRIDAFTT